MRVYNFSPGPSMLPNDVLKKIKRELYDFEGCGMSAMELSHRSKVYLDLNARAEHLLRQAMGIPDNYYVLFVQGGATMQFEGIPLNLLGKNNKADYVLTGHWANFAYESAKRYGDIVVAASSADKDYSYLPEANGKIRKDAAYVHITPNGTVHGTRYVPKLDTKVPVVADLSSCILSEEFDVSKYGVLYAGAQKNVGIAGITIIIVRKDLLDNRANVMPICPSMLQWSTHCEKIYNTPPTFVVYVLMRMLEDLLKNGGAKAYEQRNIHKAKKLYDFIDNSKMYKNTVLPEARSRMNIIFHTPNAQLDEKFWTEAEKAGLANLKGHVKRGGMRASIYNNMPEKGVDALIKFMQKFELENK